MSYKFWGYKGIIDAAKKNINEYMRIPEEDRMDKEFLIEIFLKTKSFEVLRFAPDALRKDKNFILSALNQTHNAQVLEYADESLLNNKEFILNAIKTEGLFSENNHTYGPDDDKSHSNNVLYFASDELREDEEVVLAAIQERHSEIKYSPLSKNDEFILKIIGTVNNQTDIKQILDHTPNGRIMHSYEKMKNDNAFMMDTVSNNGLEIRNIPYNLQFNMDIAIAAVANNPKAFSYIPWVFHTQYDGSNPGKAEFLQRVSNWKTIPELKILLPIKIKIMGETSNDIFRAADEMNLSIENLIVERKEKKIDDGTFNTRLDSIIDKARPTLEKQTGWRKLIDDLVNNLRSLFTSEKPITMFTKPFKAELDKLKTDVQKQPKKDTEPNTPKP